MTMQGGWEPCPLDALCENCGHPMRGHFRASSHRPLTNNSSCGECPCEHWCCQHGGMRALITLEEIAEIDAATDAAMQESGTVAAET